MQVSPLELLQQFVDASDQHELKIYRKKGYWYVELWDYSAAWKQIELKTEEVSLDEGLMRVCRMLMEQ